MLLDLVNSFQQESRFPIVEPAHMELAEPSIETAFDRCIARGATFVIVHPYFLFPGRHWNKDIPRLCSRAALKHDIPFLVTAPLGLHPLLTKVVAERIGHCLAQVQGDAESCDVCERVDRCRIRGNQEAINGGDCL